jgi:hypothetical protein
LGDSESTPPFYNEFYLKNPSSGPESLLEHKGGRSMRLAICPLPKDPEQSIVYLPELWICFMRIKHFILVFRIQVNEANWYRYHLAPDGVNLHNKIHVIQQVTVMRSIAEVIKLPHPTCKMAAY